MLNQLMSDLHFSSLYRHPFFHPLHIPCLSPLLPPRLWNPARGFSGSLWGSQWVCGRALLPNAFRCIFSQIEWTRNMIVWGRQIVVFQFRPQLPTMCCPTPHLPFAGATVCIEWFLLVSICSLLSFANYYYYFLVCLVLVMFCAVLGVYRRLWKRWMWRREFSMTRRARWKSSKTNCQQMRCWFHACLKNIINNLSALQHIWYVAYLN